MCHTLAFMFERSQLYIQSAATASVPSSIMKLRADFDLADLAEALSITTITFFHVVVASFLILLTHDAKINLPGFDLFS